MESEPLELDELVELTVNYVNRTLLRLRQHEHDTLMRLSLGGLVLHVGYTIHRSQDPSGKVKLLPCVFSMKPPEAPGSVEPPPAQLSGHVVHWITVNIATTPVKPKPVPLNLKALAESDFLLVIKTCRALRESSLEEVFAGPDSEYLDLYVDWREGRYRVEVRRRLAKLLLENLDSLQSMQDVRVLASDAEGDIYFSPLEFP